MQTARKDSVAEMLVGRANGSGGAGDVEIGMCTKWIGEFETFETEEHTARNAWRMWEGRPHYRD